MQAPLSPAREDFLKLLYALTADGCMVTNGLLVRELGISAPSVSAMVKRLTEENLVERPTAREVCLTAAGEAAALHVIRRHRLLETFLVEVLHMSWDEVHTEAERLEHALSERLTDVIDETLGHPRRDPHGDPIPCAGRRHHEKWGVSLRDAPTGTSFRVERVRDRDEEALRYLARIDAVPGAVIDVERRGPFGEPLWIRIGSTQHVLGNTLSELVHGQVLDAQTPSAVPVLEESGT